MQDVCGDWTKYQILFCSKCVNVLLWNTYKQGIDLYSPTKDCFQQYSEVWSMTFLPRGWLKQRIQTGEKRHEMKWQLFVDTIQHLTKLRNLLFTFYISTLNGWGCVTQTLKYVIRQKVMLINKLMRLFALGLVMFSDYSLIFGQSRDQSYSYLEKKKLALFSWNNKPIVVHFWLRKLFLSPPRIHSAWEPNCPSSQGRKESDE